MTTTMKSGFAVFALAIPLAACSNPADNVTEAEVKEVPAKQAGGAAVSSDAVRYEIATGSTITFVGSKVTGTHEGGFKTFDGSFTFDGEDFVGSANKVVIDMGSTWSDNERLTGHLKSADFFDVEKYPTATFVLTDIEKAAADGYKVTGNLTFHGVTKQIAFPAKVTRSGDTGKLSSEFFIKRFDFGVKYPGKTDDLIRDEVVIKLDIALKRS